MQGIRYYTNTHPLYKNGIEVEFNFNGLPYLKASNVIQAFSTNKFFEWLEFGWISSSKKKVITIDSIKKAVCNYELISTETVFKKTRQREVVEARQIIQYFAKEYKLGSLSAIGFATGHKDHATVIHSHRTIAGHINIYPEWRKRILDIKDRL